MKRIAERERMHRREPIFDIVRLRETRQAPRGREREVSCHVDRRNTFSQGFDNLANDSLLAFLAGSCEGPPRLLELAQRDRLAPAMFPVLPPTVIVLGVPQ